MVLNTNFTSLTAHELIKNIPHARRDWKWKAPMEKWCYLYSFESASADLIRLSVFKDDVTNIHWLSYAILVYMVTFMLSSLYTLSYYGYHGELMLGLGHERA